MCQERKLTLDCLVHHWRFVCLAKTVTICEILSAQERPHVLGVGQMELVNQLDCLGWICSAHVGSEV